MEANYDTFLSGLKVYGRALTEEERLILRVTRLFGECELVAPPEYLCRSHDLHPEVAVDRTLRPGGETGPGEGYTREIAEEFIARTCRRSSSTWRCRRATSIRSRSGPPTSLGHCQGHVAVHPRDRRAVRPVDRTAGAFSPARPGGRSDQLGESHQRGGTLHQGHLCHRRSGVGPAGHGVVQLGRAKGHQSRPADAGQSARAEFLEAARAAIEARCRRRPTTTSSTSSRRR